MSGVRILDWRPMNKGSVLGFAKVEMPSGMILADVCILNGQNGPWASPPSKPMMGKDGPVKDRDGKQKYVNLVEFNTKETKQRWSDAVIAAMRDDYPDVLE